MKRWVLPATITAWLMVFGYAFGFLIFTWPQYSNAQTVVKPKRPMLRHTWQVTQEGSDEPHGHTIVCAIVFDGREPQTTEHELSDFDPYAKERKRSKFDAGHVFGYAVTDREGYVYWDTRRAEDIGCVPIDPSRAPQWHPSQWDITEPLIEKIDSGPIVADPGEGEIPEPKPPTTQPGPQPITIGPGGIVFVHGSARVMIQGSAEAVQVSGESAIYVGEPVERVQIEYEGSE